MGDATSDRLRDGQTFGRYQIVRMLGEGGMGAVYEAVHTGLRKRFAIKTLLPSIAALPGGRARFLREGEAASRINHPNVVDVSDVDTEDGLPFLVMEYLQGETLGDLMFRKGAMTVELTVDLLLPVLSAVNAGHDQGVIHRDLKPHNIFLARGAFGESVPKVLDFGVSKIVDADTAPLTGTMSVLGTTSYMSPEQARGAKTVEPASDQYALGLIFFEMLAGRRAHDGDSPLEVLHKIATAPALSVREVRPEVPVEIDAVIAKMLAAKPADRYVSLRVIARSLLPFASERIRVGYRSAFDEPDPGRRSTGIMPAIPAAASGGTMVMPAQQAAETSPGPTSGARPAPVAGGTRMLPQPKPDTTLGQGATEARPANAPERRRGKGLFVAVGALVAVGVVVAIRSLASHAPSPADATTTTAPSAATTARGAPAQESPPAAHAPAESPPAATGVVTSPVPTIETAPKTATAPTLSTQPDAGKHHHHHDSKAAAKPAAPEPKPAERVRRGANNAPIIE